MVSTEVLVDQSPPIKQSKEPWVSVAQGKQVLKKFEFEMLESEGKKSIEVPSMIIEKGNPLWEDFVVARFLETAPHVAKVHMIVNKIWAFGEKDQKLDVYEMDETTMRIRITNERVRGKVVRRGMWNIAGVPMIVSNWSPEEDASKASLIPLWVHVTGVPISMYSWDGLSFITSAVGVPDHLHSETLACKNFDIAKVFVKADLSKDLPDMIDYNIQGTVTTVCFTYPWLPPKCTNCGRWGHYETFCKETKKEVEVEKTSKPAEKKAENQLEGVMQKSAEKVVENGEKKSLKESSPLSESGGEQNAEKREMKGREWEKVYVEKAGRSPKSHDLKFGQVMIATPSRYAALRNSDEKGEEIQEDTDEVEEGEVVVVEEIENEDAEDVCQRRIEESIEAKKGRIRQTLPRQSKTNHRLFQGRGTNKNL
ncbi:hypothetical protein Bca4012_023428 [Brassica carinata]